MKIPLSDWAARHYNPPPSSSRSRQPVQAGVFEAGRRRYETTTWTRRGAGSGHVCGPARHRAGAGEGKNRSMNMKRKLPERMGLDAIRQAIEERDAMEQKYHDLAEHMVYQGNSVSWWHSKANAYRDALDAVWKELRAAGVVADGVKTSADGVRELAARAGVRQVIDE